MSLVWSEKGIIQELKRLLGWEPSRSTFWRWRQNHGLPVKERTGRLCADVQELEQWRNESFGSIVKH